MDLQIVRNPMRFDNKSQASDAANASIEEHGASHLSIDSVSSHRFVFQGCFGLEGIQGLKIKRRLVDGSGESAGCVGGWGYSGRALHQSMYAAGVSLWER